MPVVPRMDWSRAVQLAEAQGERLTLDGGLYTFQVDFIDVTLASYDNSSAGNPGSGQ